MANLKGIDVSAWQGKINWEKVKPQIDFAILRVGYGSNIVSQDDKTFKTNADACTKLGIPFGVYIYSYAKSTSMAKSEAEHVLRLIKGYKLDYPVYLDLEDAGTTGKCSNKTILEMTKAFVDAIEKAGYEVGVYANTYWWTTKLTDSYYNKRSKWVAQYNSKCTYKGEYDIWQYSSKGAVSGISGNVDMNICYKTFIKEEEPVKKEEPKKTETKTEAKKDSKLSVGDKVTITGAYAASAYGTKASHTASKGKTAYIVKIYEGTNFPYQLGVKAGDASSNNTIGFAKASAISEGETEVKKETPLAVGDKVKITGAYASSASSAKAEHTSAKGQTRYIVKIYNGTNFPYQLGAKKGDASGSNTTGFANAKSIARA